MGGEDGGGLAGLLGGGVDWSVAVELVELMEAGFTGQKQVTVRGKVQTWYYRDGRRVPGPKKEEPAKGKKEKAPKLTVDQAHEIVKQHLAAGKVDAAGAKELAG